MGKYRIHTAPERNTNLSTEGPKSTNTYRDNETYFVNHAIFEIEQGGWAHFFQKFKNCLSGWQCGFTNHITAIDVMRCISEIGAAAVVQ